MSVVTASYAGSSPLARGLPPRQRRRRVGDGIIPARAGFTVFGPDSRALTRDHPRSRGVYAAAGLVEDAETGSSPLARGLPTRRHLTAPSRRIIPARAGFTATVRPRWPQPRDHPRSRGVYSRACQGARLSRGSSPLARGLRLGPAPSRGRAGIIPARAGFTTSHEHLPRGHEDHPRSRGVYCPSCFGLRAHPGSSPLARGLPNRPKPHAPRIRIIPARAGFTQQDASPGTGLRDHPRSRGVYLTGSADAVVLDDVTPGSSPLARGLR